MSRDLGTHVDKVAGVHWSLPHDVEDLPSYGWLGWNNSSAWTALASSAVDGKSQRPSTSYDNPRCNMYDATTMRIVQHSTSAYKYKCWHLPCRLSQYLSSFIVFRDRSWSSSLRDGAPHLAVPGRGFWFLRNVPRIDDVGCQVGLRGVHHLYGKRHASNNHIPLYA